MTMVLIFLHTFWGIIFFHGCEHRRWWEIATVVIMHLTVSGSVSSCEQSSALEPVFGVGVVRGGPCAGGRTAFSTREAVGFVNPGAGNHCATCTH